MDPNASSIAIANYAITKFGGKQISSFTDGSQTAVIINSIYSQCLSAVLEEHPWSFATRTEALATLSVTLPDFGDGVSIAYALPSDYVKLYMVNYPSAIVRQPVFAKRLSPSLTTNGEKKPIILQ